EFSVPKTPQQNGIAERKNRTLIEGARTMLADSLLPIPFWAENKEGDATFDGKEHDFEYFSEDNSNDVSAASHIVHAARQNCSNNTNPISAAGPSNSKSSSTHRNSSLKDASQSLDVLEMENIIYSDNENEPKRVHQDLKDSSWIEAMQEEILQFKMQKVWILVDLPQGKRAIVKQSNDVTRIQALVDKRKVVVTEATIRDALHLDDADGVECLPNEEIFATLARMGYEKPSTKLTFYKAFFSSQWKFLIHTILQSLRVETPLFKGMLAARETENQGDAEEQGDEEEQGNNNNAAEELVTVVDDVTDQSTQSPTPLTPPPQQHQDIPSTSQVQSPPPQQQSPPPAQPQGAHFPMSLLQEALDACAALNRHVEHLEQDKGRMIDESDKDEGAKLMNEKEKKET
nr:putative ribonuclease H-like domain-containing protein [Tanacetum cinerariifolium]